MFASVLVKTELLLKGRNNHAALCLRSILLPLHTFFPMCIKCDAVWKAQQYEIFIVMRKIAAKGLARQSVLLTFYGARKQRCLDVNG